MTDDLRKLAQIALDKSQKSLVLVQASLDNIPLYDIGKTYTPKELEPFDALSDRFVRSIEICIKFFRSYERFLYAENSDTLRDLLNHMEKINLISSTELWIDMREIRNRIVHDYIPEKIAQVYEIISNEFAIELASLKRKIDALKLNI